jgi:hypothetical protein
MQTNLVGKWAVAYEGRPPEEIVAVYATSGHAYATLLSDDGTLSSWTLSSLTLVANPEVGGPYR